MHGHRYLTTIGRHLAVVAAYATVYEILDLFKLPQLMLMSGLRISCLFLVPRKYWPALVVGETLPVLDRTIECAPVFGVPWAVATTIPLILPCMPVFAALIKRLPLRDANGNLPITTVVRVTLVLISIDVVGVFASLFFAYVSSPHPVQAWVSSIESHAPSYLVGYYLGALTIAPVVLVLHEYATRRRRRSQWRPLIRDASMLVAPYLAAVVTAARVDTFAAVVFTVLAIILPVVSMTANHGKRGAAIGGMLSSIAMSCTFTAKFDPTTLGAETLLALVITAALISTRPSRPIRTFGTYPRAWAALDRASFYFERRAGRLWARFRRAPELL